MTLAFSPSSSSSFLVVGDILLVVPTDARYEPLGQALRQSGFGVRQVTMAAGVLDVLRTSLMDAVLIVDDLPDLPVPALCKLIRREPGSSRVPILVLGQSPAPQDVVLTLKAGADDYLSVDDDVQIIVARLKALLRRCAWAEPNGDDMPSEMPETVLRVGEILLRPDRHAVFVSGEPVDLTVSEYRILSLLAQHTGRVVRREQVYNCLHLSEFEFGDRSIDSHLYTLRRKLGVARDYIVTVRGVGYILRKPEL